MVHIKNGTCYCYGKNTIMLNLNCYVCRYYYFAVLYNNEVTKYFLKILKNKLKYEYMLKFKGWEKGKSMLPKNIVIQK